MSEAKHTPGPWEALKTYHEGHASAAWYINAPNGKDGRSKSVAHIKQSTIQPTEANARLIAAAPTMLTALEHCLNWLPADSAAACEARAAIAKATGESQ